MKCKFCREEIPEGAKVCPTCGTPVEPEAEETQDTGRTQDQQTQYQYGIPGQNQQGGYQYGTPGQSQQGGYQYGTPNQGNYGQPQKPVSGTPYMVFAILITLLCCLPFGIAAIVYASKINACQKAGDYAGAQEAAKKARLFSIIGAVGGVLVLVVYIAIGGFALLSSEKDGSADDWAQSITNERDDDIYDDINDDDIDDDDRKVKTKPVEQSGELGDTWDSYTVQINDKVLTFPCTLADVEATGLVMDEEYTPDGYMVNAQEYVLVYCEDANDNELMFDVVNTADEAKTVRECVVGGVSVDDYDLEGGGLTVIFPGGIQIGSTKEDVIGKYGEPDDAYEEEDDLHMYTWYGEDSYYVSCEVYVDPSTGRITHMGMENYGQ